MSHPRKLIRDGLTIADQFRLVQQLGQGGMGTVWSAEDLRLGRPVAIKFLSNEFLNDEQARMRFAREPRLASKIRSPHVVQVYAQGTTDDNVPYLVMELLEGEDLAAHIARQGPCSLAEAGLILEQVCRALSRAHREGLVHRDIKPHNIFLTPESDGQMFVKLLDFGIAKDVSARITTLTLTGEVVGSALYVSPEQLHEANSVGPSTDIWSLGIVLYEVLTGRLPFEGRSLPELFMRVVEGHYTPVSEVGRGLPKALDGFFEQVIQQDPKRRFQSVDELGAAFGRIVRANSSGLLLKQDTPRTLPVAELIAPGVNPMSKPENAMLVDRTTDRLAKPWPRALAAAVFVACVVAAVFAFRMRRDGSQPPVTSRPPVASASDAPAQSGPAREAAPPTAAVASQPPPAANALPPAVAADLPAGKSGFPETARTPKPKAAATPASTPRPNSTNAPLKPMPHNHGF